MKPIIALAVLALFVVGLWLTIRVRQNQNRIKPSESATSAYLGLRNLALKNPITDVPSAKAIKPGEPFAVLMDWGIPAGTATVAAYADGTASVYLSNGGGFLGGGQAHESIRNAAIKTVEIAGELKSLMQPTTTYPLPGRGQVVFYVRTDAGVFTATVPEDDLRSHRSPLYKLGDSAQTIITEYRQTQEQKCTRKQR